MTTEDDFQAALDANPADWQTRLVFADWLQDRGDSRAEGYRALGWLRVRPYFTKPHDQWCFTTDLNFNSDYRANCIPDDLFSLIDVVPERDQNGNRNRTERWLYFDLRADLENAAARAFLELPAERRAEIFATPPEERNE